MATETSSRAVAARGGSFLIEERAPAEVFTPEDFTRRAAHDRRDRGGRSWRTRWCRGCPEILALKYETTRELLRKAGELGLLGIEIPEEYGGLGLDKVSGCIASENVGARRQLRRARTWATPASARCRSSTSGRRSRSRSTCRSWRAASGSLPTRCPRRAPARTRMNAKTKAVLSADGKSWMLNGEKMWITNAGFADVFIVFAKVDGEQFTAFIIEKGSPGVTLGRRGAARSASRAPRPARSSWRTHDPASRTCWARSARATRSPSTSSTSGASSWARASPAGAKLAGAGGVGVRARAQGVRQADRGASA